MMNQREDNTRYIVEILIKISILILLFFYCFELLLPFIMPFLWAIIIAVAINPLHQSLQKKLGGKEKITATIITIAILSLLLIPLGIFISSVSETILSFKKLAETGGLHLDQPSPLIQSWPLVGKPLYSFYKMHLEVSASYFKSINPKFYLRQNC